MTTETDIVNQALQVMGGNQPPVTGNAPNFDTSTAGVAAKSLYMPCVRTVGRQFGWDFARNTVALEETGNSAPYPWAFEYKYPTNGVEVWQLSPQAETDPFDPVPVNFVIANNLIGTAQQRVIHTDLSPAQAIFNNNPRPDAWDDLFRESVVRLLSSELAIAIGGKPDTSQLLLTSGAAFVAIAEGRPD